MAVLLRAAGLLAARNMTVTVDILGVGPLADLCREASRAFTGPTVLNMLGTVAYGSPLFELVWGYHAVILPSLSDEQPRIVYDAYSQAVPVLGSATAGLRDCVMDRETGSLVAPNDPVALADLIESAAARSSELESMGLAALRIARRRTHRNMHRDRQALLLEHFPALRP